MRIAIDVRSLMEGRFSGVEEYTKNIIRSLVAEASQHQWSIFYNAYRAVHVPTFAGVAVDTFSYPNKLFTLSQAVARYPRWDSLIKADCWFMPNMGLLPLSSTAPYVVVAHDLSYERFPQFYSWRHRTWHRMVRPRQLMHGATHVIADSASTAQDVTGLYDIASDKVTVVHPGVPDAVPGSSVARVRTKYDLPERFVLYFGTHEPRKNIPSIVAAFSAVAQDIPHHLVIAGSPGWKMGEIDQAITTAEAQDRIHRIGFVEPADKMELYAAADLFVYPSFYEGFGFPPLEALLAGTPVITSHNSSLPEVVGEWATLIDPYNPAELAAVMRELALDPPVVTDEDKRSIRQQYSWRESARRITDIIEAAVV